jgi:hypothetical protein
VQRIEKQGSTVVDVVVEEVVRAGSPDRTVSFTPSVTFGVRRLHLLLEGGRWIGGADVGAVTRGEPAVFGAIVPLVPGGVALVEPQIGPGAEGDRVPEPLVVRPSW